MLWSLSRFVKCSKCNNFFVVMIEDRKGLNMASFLGSQGKPQLKQPVKQTPPPTPKKIYEFLNKYIIGQDKAKKTISVAVYNHYKRIFNNNNNNNNQASPNQSQQQQQQRFNLFYFYFFFVVYY